MEITIKTAAAIKPMNKIAGIFILPTGITESPVCQREHTMKKAPKGQGSAGVAVASIGEVGLGLVDLCRGLVCRGVNAAIGGLTEVGHLRL